MTYQSSSQVPEGRAGPVDSAFEVLGFCRLIHLFAHLETKNVIRKDEDTETKQGFSFPPRARTGGCEAEWEAWGPVGLGSLRMYF